MNSSGTAVDFDALKKLVFEVVGQRVIGIDQRSRGKCSSFFTYNVVSAMTLTKMRFVE